MTLKVHRQKHTRNTECSPAGGDSIQTPRDTRIQVLRRFDSPEDFLEYFSGIL